MLPLVALLSTLGAQARSDPLPSWNAGSHKQAIVAFVPATTTKGSPQFVPVDERIATFDNDGTLWGEQPMYVQFVFARDRQARQGSGRSRQARLDDRGYEERLEGRLSAQPLTTALVHREH